jgi:peptidoglycan/xylan/chitin deacetylase (PgdA/CDA1 family)
MSRVRTFGDGLLRWSPAQTWFRWRATRRLAVLAYHEIADADRFGEHLDHLRSTARPVSVEEVVDAARGRYQLPSRAVLVTFDDGDRSLVEVAMPMLRERGIPAAAFVIPSLLDTDEPFWWDEVTELVRAGARSSRAPANEPGAAVRALKGLPDGERLAAIDELRNTRRGPKLRAPQLRREELALLESAGIEIGSHSYSHVSLARCSAEVVETEITRAHEALAAAAARPPRAFAYPNGDEDPGAEAILRDLGYEVAFLFDHRLAPLPLREPLRISRLRVNSDTSTDRFRIILSGLHPTVHRVRGGS